MSLRFNYSNFIDSLKKDNELKVVLNNYIQDIEPIFEDYKKQIWYKEYVSKFKPISYNVPVDLKDSFDWDLLVQLLASSFVFRCFYDCKTKDLIVTVRFENKLWTTSVSKLNEEQILSFFEDSFQEHIISTSNIYNFVAFKKNVIINQRLINLNKWERQLREIDIKNKSEQSLKNILGNNFFEE